MQENLLESYADPANMEHEFLKQHNFMASSESYADPANMEHEYLKQKKFMARILKIDEFLGAFIVDSDPLDLSMGKCLCALAKVLEVAVAYYREKEFYVRVALTLENPEMFQVLSWTPGQKLTHPSAKNVQELRFLSIIFSCPGYSQ
jgi:hypothetical protein